MCQSLKLKSHAKIVFNLTTITLYHQVCSQIISRSTIGRYSWMFQAEKHIGRRCFSLTSKIVREIAKGFNYWLVALLSLHYLLTLYFDDFSTYMVISQNTCVSEDAQSRERVEVYLGNDYPAVPNFTTLMLLQSKPQFR